MKYVIVLRYPTLADRVLVGNSNRTVGFPVSIQPTPIMPPHLVQISCRRRNRPVTPTLPAEAPIRAWLVNSIGETNQFPILDPLFVLAIQFTDKNL